VIAGVLFVWNKIAHQLFADPSMRRSVPTRVILTRRGFCSTISVLSKGKKNVAETHEFLLLPGVYRAIKGADRSMTNLQLLDDLSGEQLGKLHSEFRQVCIGE